MNNKKVYGKEYREKMEKIGRMKNLPSKEEWKEWEEMWLEISYELLSYIDGVGDCHMFYNYGQLLEEWLVPIPGEAYFQSLSKWHENKKYSRERKQVLYFLYEDNNYSCEYEKHYGGIAIMIKEEWRHKDGSLSYSYHASSNANGEMGPKDAMRAFLSMIRCSDRGVKAFDFLREKLRKYERELNDDFVSNIQMATAIKNAPDGGLETYSTQRVIIVHKDGATEVFDADLFKEEEGGKQIVIPEIVEVHCTEASTTAEVGNNVDKVRRGEYEAVLVQGRHWNTVSDLVISESLVSWKPIKSGNFPISII